MAYDAILSLFDAYQKRFPAERKTVEWIRRFVRENKNCFDRELLVGHITGSAWVLNASRNSTLLTHHRKLDMWVQLGGHADGNADVADVALREAKEESGLSDVFLLSPEIFDIDVHLIPSRKQEPAHFHYDCRFLAQADTENDFVVSDESHDLAWIPLTRVSDYTNELSVMRMVEKTKDFLSAIGDR